MDEALINALKVIADGQHRLSDEHRFDWPAAVRQAVYRLALGSAGDRLPVLAAVVGGASSGKSTVFNNLLDGHLASRITARGHATLGPILAVHEDHRAVIEPLLAEGRLLPGFRRVAVELDDNTAGQAEAVAVLYHTVDPLRDVLLTDTPDFTSDAARREGDVALSLLPWFDRLVVVADHERWFDRQSISMLRAESVRFGQQRLVLFNRTLEGPLADIDREALCQQAGQIAAEGSVVLEFRRGRGFCVFPAGTLDNVHSFLRAPRPDRSSALLGQVAAAANGVLSQNEARAARLDQLRTSLAATTRRALPSTWDCMTSLMMPSERRQLEIVARVLRIQDTRQWLIARTERIRNALKRIPVVGTMVPRSHEEAYGGPGETADRSAIAAAYYEAVCKRQIHDLRLAIRSSPFWSELRTGTGLEPAERSFEWDAASREDVRAAGKAFDDALARWTAAVEEECRGVSPHFHGAIGVGVAALAIVLIAVPGPVSAFTLVSAKGAIGAALGQLAAATGAGALLGKHVARLATVIHEKLLGGAEYDAVQEATASFRARLEAAGRGFVDEAVTEASRLVMRHDEPLTQALQTVCDAREGS